MDTQTQCRACKKDLTGLESTTLRSEDGVFCSQDCVQDFNKGIMLVLSKKSIAILSLMVLGLGVSACVWAIQGLLSGKIDWVEGPSIIRSKDPILYWTSISGISLVGLLFLTCCGWAVIWYFRHRKRIRFR